MQAIIYTRTSTQNQEQGHEAQLHACYAWAESQGVKIKSVYRDYISGGAELDKRTGFLEAIQDLEEGDLLLAYRRDRIGRDVVINAVAENLIQRQGATLRTLDVSSENTPESALLRTLLDAISSYERSIIRARTKAVLMSKKSRNAVCGNVELGKKAIGEEGNKQLVIDEEEQAKIDLVRSWRASGLTYKELQERCEAEEVTTRQGYTPTEMTLHRWTKDVVMSKRAKKSYDKRVNKGGRSGFRGKRKLDEDKALKALLINLVKSGVTQRGIAQELAENGLTTSKGNPYDSKQIRRWINELKEEGVL